MRVLMLVLAMALAAVAYMAYQRHRAPIEFLEVTEKQDGLPKLWQIPEFSLTDQSGKSISLSDLQGSVWAADFFYTTCPGPCRMLSTGMSEVQKALSTATDARFVSISSDPEKDSPPVLQEYARQFGASEHWLFLTGDKAGIYALANQGFKLSVVEDRGSAEPIVHSTKMVLVDRSGSVRGFYDGLTEEGKAKLIRDFRRLLVEKP